MENEEIKLNSQVVFNGRIMKVTSDDVKLQNGKITKREVVHHNGGACVLAIDAQGFAYFVKQYRYPFSECLLEIPAGKLEEGEQPGVTAKRELIEECGLSAKKVKSLGVLFPTVAYCTEKIYIYYADEFETVAQHLDEDEFLDIVKIPFDKAVEMVKENLIPDAKTQIAILKAALLRGYKNEL